VCSGGINQAVLAHFKSSQNINFSISHFECGHLIPVVEQFTRFPKLNFSCFMRISEDDRHKCIPVFKPRYHFGNKIFLFNSKCVWKFMTIQMYRIFQWTFANVIKPYSWHRTINTTKVKITKSSALVRIQKVWKNIRIPY